MAAAFCWGEEADSRKETSGKGEFQVFPQMFSNPACLSKAQKSPEACSPITLISHVCFKQFLDKPVSVLQLRGVGKSQFVAPMPGLYFFLLFMCALHGRLNMVGF